MTWNEDRERIIAAAELGDATPQVAADLLVAARKRAFEAYAAHEWIPTSERYPDGSHARVLALVIDDTGRPRVELVVFCLLGPLWRFDQDDCAIEEELVTHWMQLPPEPPK